MELKQCPRCKEIKSIEEYQRNRTAKDGLQYHCKTCRKTIDNRSVKRIYDRERYHSDKDSYRQNYYKREYNLSISEYDKLYKKQQSVCAICKTVCSTGRRLAVDHCHTTGKVRGLLCSKCNRALGFLKDDIEIIENLLNYLKAGNNEI